MKQEKENRELVECLEYVKHMLEAMPCGFDLEADENNESPEDLSQHVIGLMLKRIKQTFEGVNKMESVDISSEPQTSYSVCEERTYIVATIRLDGTLPKWTKRIADKTFDSADEAFAYCNSLPQEFHARVFECGVSVLRKLSKSKADSNFVDSSLRESA